MYFKPKRYHVTNFRYSDKIRTHLHAHDYFIKRNDKSDVLIVCKFRDRSGRTR